VGRHHPRCQSPHPLQNGVPWPAAPWACIAGLNLIKNACRPDPHVVEHLPTSTPAAVRNSSSRSRSSGVNSIPARLSATDHAPGAGRAMGWVGAHGRLPLVATLSRCDDDPMPTTGRTSRWAGLDRGLSRHGNEPGRPRRLRLHGMLSARLWSGSGDGSSPNEDDLAPTTSRPDLTVEGCGEPHPGRPTVAQAGQHGSDNKQGKN
jgi:hypothetical protein